MGQVILQGYGLRQEDRDSVHDALRRLGVCGQHCQMPCKDALRLRRALNYFALCKRFPGIMCRNLFTLLLFVVRTGLVFWGTNFSTFRDTLLKKIENHAKQLEKLENAAQAAFERGQWCWIWPHPLLLPLVPRWYQLGH
jgi:hypothetical protein